MRATLMYGAGDVRVENVPDAQPDRADRRARPRHPRRDLRQRPLAVQVDGADRRPAGGWGTSSSASSRPSAPRCARSRRATSSSRRSLWSDGTCVFCREGLQTSCLHGGRYGAATSTAARARPCASRRPTARSSCCRSAQDDALMPSLLTLSDVMGTGHHAALAAQVAPGKTVAVVGDGAVGLCGVIAAQAARRRADHPARPPRRPDRARRRSSARPTSSASAARRRSSASAS